MRVIKVEFADLSEPQGCFGPDRHAPERRGKGHELECEIVISRPYRILFGKTSLKELCTFLSRNWEHGSRKFCKEPSSQMDVVLRFNALNRSHRNPRSVLLAFLSLAEQSDERDVCLRRNILTGGKALGEPLSSCRHYKPE